MNQSKASSKTIINFLLNEYKDEQAAVDYLTEKRWPDGVSCPYCKGKNIGGPYKGSQPFKCHPCNRRFGVKTGTFMHNSPIPVRAWLLMAFFMAKSRTGESSVWLSKQLGITQKSTWYMGHRIRQACSQEHQLLIGVVEIDETYPGGLKKNMHAKDRRKHTGRGAVGKMIVVGAKERNGRVVARVIPNTKKRTLQGFIQDNVIPGSVVITDEHRSYLGVDKLGYRHHSVNHSRGEYVKGIAHTNSIESFWALVKRAIKGTYTHVSQSYLQRYLDEITMRENNDDFIKLICQNACAKL